MMSSPSNLSIWTIPVLKYSQVLNRALSSSLLINHFYHAIWFTPSTPLHHFWFHLISSYSSTIIMGCGCGSTCTCTGAQGCTCDNTCSCKGCGVCSPSVFKKVHEWWNWRQRVAISRSKVWTWGIQATEYPPHSMVSTVLGAVQSGVPRDWIPYNSDQFSILCFSCENV